MDAVPSEETGALTEPLSASRGFFGSRPFSRANALLDSMGAGAVDWHVAGEA